ncbi:MAG: hypothetical protein IJ636_00230 [Bacteroidales bacterium]|nr:hypothetical protein [Bacteroidales bacterium]
MKRDLHTLLTVLAAALLALATAGSCSVELDPGTRVESGSDAGDVSVSLALALSSGSAPATKMTDAITQAGGTTSSFRGIEKVYILPFAERVSEADEQTVGPVKMSSPRWAENPELRQTGITTAFGESANGGNWPGLVNNINAHLYNLVSLRRSTGSVLVYGEAIPDGDRTTAAGMHHNGVLEPVTASSGDNALEAATRAGEIGFNLKPIITDESELNSAVAGLLTYLNSIAGAGTWSTSLTTNTDLYNLYRGFIQSSVSTDSQAINLWLSALYDDLNSLTLYGNNARAIRTAVLTAINNADYVTVSGTTVTLKNSYDTGVPAGVTRIKWQDNAFKLVSGGTVNVNGTSLPIAPPTLFCYPPSLWYYTNSNLRVTESLTIADEYNESASASWTTFQGSKYNFGPVGSGTTSAAVVRPLNYGVGRMELSLSVSIPSGNQSNCLEDNDGAYVFVNNDNFPLTAVIIDSQRNQEFDFTPKTGVGYYSYDTEVNIGTTPKIHLRYFGSSASTNTPVSTLVVQTEPEEKVHFALEFQNNSGASFVGADGTIRAGGKFYLVGELDYNDPQLTEKPVDCIFYQDRVTRVNATINSLAKAYNAVPDFRSEVLQIGILTKMNWIQVTPSEKPLF